jgi:hypothetical protein
MSRRASLFFPHVLLLAAIAWISTPLAEEGRTSLCLTKLLSTMRSEELKQLAQKRYGELFERDPRIAGRALDFFHDVRAEIVLMESLQHPDLGVKAYAARLMKEVFTKPEPGLVEYLSVQLEGTRPLPGGGAELGIFWVQYKASLVELIAKLTGLDFHGLDPVEDSDLSQIVARTREWVAQHKEKEK